MARHICVVGAGKWGMNHIRTLHRLGHLGGVVDCKAEQRRTVAGEFPDIPLFERLEAALEHDFDGFIVASPADTHAQLAAAIIRRRRPVLVEKPLALNARDARQLCDLAAEHGVNLMVGHVLLFHPAIRKIKELLSNGKIGKLEYLYSNRLNLGTVRTQEDILWSFAPHDISIFQYLVDDLPVDVFSKGATCLRPQIHDTSMTVLTYPGNIVGHIFVSWLHPFKEHRLVVIGSKGMLSFEDSSGDKNLLFYEKGIDWVQGEPIKRDGPTETIGYARRMPLTEELEYFVDHLDGPPVEIGDGAAAVRVLEILERASTSLLSSSAPQDTAGEGGDFFVHASSVVDDDVVIGRGTCIWHFSHVQAGARIGEQCTLGQNVYVGSGVHIGNHVKIQNNVSVYEGVELEDYVFCGPSMVFTNVPDPRSKYPQRGAEHYRLTRVCEGASIGANATIVCGHTIGRHAFIAAGAVVTGDVPDYALMVGVPARQAGWVCECGQRLPPFEERTCCRRCERHYLRRGHTLSPITLDRAALRDAAAAGAERP